MRYPIALILFICVALRPAINVGYVLYYELNIDYIIEELCVNKDKPQLQCNGKCFLTQKLTQDTVVDEDAPATAVRVARAFYPVYFRDIEVVDIGVKIILKSKEYFTITSLKTITFYSSNDEPPEIIV